MLIDFYVFIDLTLVRGMQFVCSLIDKFYLEHSAIFVHTTHSKEAEYLDQLLWTYRDDSFIPHHLQHETCATASCPTPIHISEKIPTDAFQGIFINLNATLTPQAFLYSRLVEIVFPEANVQQLARERYKYYQSHGHQLTTYKIKTSDL